MRRHSVAAPEVQVLEPVPQIQQLRAVALQLPGQLGGGDKLSEPVDYQDVFGGPLLDPWRAESVKALNTRPQWRHR